VIEGAESSEDLGTRRLVHAPEVARALQGVRGDLALALGLAASVEARCRSDISEPPACRARVGVWGVSQAGWFIPVLASRAPWLVFAIVLTGGGSTPRDVEMFMHRAPLGRANASNEDVAEVERLLAAYFDWLGGRGNRDEVMSLVQQASSTPGTAQGLRPPDGTM
jgi:hypothetical protein